MRATLLGCGTSTGVPVIGCTCAVCGSDDPRNRRLRTGLKLEVDGRVVLVDTPTDLRQQALRFGLPRVDAVLFTHAHADHTLGLDELRVFNFRQSSAIPCYGSPATLADIRRHFAYAFEPGEEGGGKPRLDLIAVDGSFEAAGLETTAVPVRHGSLEVFGYRWGDLAYVTDCSFMPEPSFRLLRGVRWLVLGALRHRPHSTHFSIAEAIAAARRIGAERTVFTHMGHEVDFASASEELPKGIELGYDGLVLDT
ncbi:MAG: MBL fold metallo-hydrolase [Thermoanaerobaculia bacterium]